MKKSTKDTKQDNMAKDDEALLPTDGSIITEVDEAESNESGFTYKPQPRKKPKTKLIILVGLIFILLISALVGWLAYQRWYSLSLEPLSTHQRRIIVKVKPGMTARGIGDLLESSGVIRNGYAFYIYTCKVDKQDELQAGSYMFSPNQSVEQVVDMLAAGKTNIFNVTILPGMTLTQIKQQLIKDGFTAKEVERAFQAKYSSPLLKSRPQGASLEGYIFPDTYQIDMQTSAKQLLEKTFDNFYSKLKDAHLENGLKSRKLSLYQLITLASIVQEEDSNKANQPQIAQVFLTRLDKGMKLGSDVTAIYGAQINGHDDSPAAAVAFDSVYNTRLHKGLPPGPIANFNFSAIQSVARPASGDYLYFVAGDDHRVHFAHTEQEHQQNIDKYCHKLCSE